MGKNGGIRPAQGPLEYQSMSIRIVLVGTSHPGNIGSAARAMKTMGLERLYLVAPERFPAPEATMMAAGADDVLQNARVVPDLRAAIADCGLVVGTTARGRHLPWRIVEPREAALEVAAAAAASEVALLFGAERTGLHNDDLKSCHTLLTIPTGSEYTSLNLAMAVQVVAYEVCLALRDRGAAGGRGEGPVPLASAADMETFYVHLERVLEEIDFRDRTGSGHLMARLRRLFQRTVLDQNEINILRGILTAVQGRRRRAGDPHLRGPGPAS
jgi:TrmH family RNA methyltransferase